MKTKFYFPLLLLVCLSFVGCNQTGTEYIAESIEKLNGKLHTKTIYHYNERGQKIEEIIKEHDIIWKNKEKVEYKYSGSLLTQKTEYSYQKEKKEWKEQYRTCWTYTNNRISKIKEYFGKNEIGHVRKYIYKKGKLSKVQIYYGGESKSNLYGYGKVDKDGRIIEELFYEGEIIPYPNYEDEKNTFSYDQFGRIEYECFEEHHEGTSEEYKYKYNDRGYLTDKYYVYTGFAVEDDRTEHYTYTYKIKRKEFKSSIY